MIVAVFTMTASVSYASAAYVLIEENVVMHEALEARARKMHARLTHRQADYGYASLI